MRHFIAWTLRLTFTTLLTAGAVGSETTKKYEDREIGKTAPISHGRASSPASVCGNVDGDAGGGIDIADLSALFDYLFLTHTPPSNLADANLDSRELVTARDAMFLVDFLYISSRPLSCLVTLPPMNPPADPTTVVSMVPASIPAGQLTTHVEMELGNYDALGGFALPIQVLVGGQPATGLSNIVMGPMPIRGAFNKGGGKLILTSFRDYDSSINPGSHLLVQFDVTVSISAMFDRAVTFKFISLPPMEGGVNVNSPVVFENDYPFNPRLPYAAPLQGCWLQAVKSKVNVGEPVFFSGVATVAVDDNTWQWDFGDGSTGSGKNPIHTYDGAVAGPFTVSATVNLTSGGTASGSRFSYISLNPVIAKLKGIPRAGVAPLSVTFTDESSGSPDTWLWDFGDGNTSSLQHPTHNYAVAGVYDVCLTASNPMYTDTRCLLSHIRADVSPTPDLQMLSFCPNRIRKGRAEKLVLTARNVGTDDVSGAQMTLDLSTLPATVIASQFNPSPSVTLPGPILKWNLPVLTWDPSQLAFDDYEVRAVLTVDPNAAVGVGFNISASIDPAFGEVNLANNLFQSGFIIVVPYDPNDKQMQPQGCGDQHARLQSGDMSFMISFENKPTASASALYVIVIDTLSPLFDWSTLAPGSSSHPVDFSFDEQSGEMIWIFDGINLPPNINPPEGEGFVSYSIRPKNNLLTPATIPNQAYIRFDYENWIAAPGAGPLQVVVDDDANQNGVPDLCDPCCAASAGNVDCDPIDGTDISDLSALIDNLYIAFTPLCCVKEANVDGQPGIDISDLSALIDYLYISFTPPAVCQ